jgi:hypothetical protein
VNAETDTISWFAIQEGPSSFAIFDTFDDEAGRDAHLADGIVSMDLFVVPTISFRLCNHAGF